MNIATLLKKPEGKTLEFKRDVSSPENILKTMIAFANTAGGTLVIGIDDKAHNPLGIEDPLEAEERLFNLIADSITPRLVPNIELTTHEGVTLLLVEVYLSSTRPHWFMAKGEEHGVFVRLGSSNRQADCHLIAELRRSVEGIAYDEQPIPQLSVDDLDLGAIQALFGEKKHLEENRLRTLRLLHTEQGRSVPTRGAVLLFGKNRTRHFPDAWVQCGRFIGRDKAQIFDHIELHDTMPQVIDSMMLFLKKHAMRSADFSDTRRKDVWSIPLTILREAVINALVHADYSQRGAPIRIAFFDDRIEIENPGILPPGMTIDDMMQGISKIRNPVIARVFRELNFIEQWGSGVPRMFREAKELGLPEPQIIEIGMRLRFIVTLAKPIDLLKKPVDSSSQPELGVESQPESLEARVLKLLENGSLSKSELAGKLGQKAISGQLNKVIRELLAKKRIEYTSPEKPNSRMQKYRKKT